jgi:hypothetical protein
MFMIFLRDYHKHIFVFSQKPRQLLPQNAKKQHCALFLPALV